jgi:hypothetical protein
MVRPAMAHVGTSGVFVQGAAGPYAVYVTVTPPTVVPGEALVSVVCDAADVRSVAVQANVLGGSATQYMPEGVALTPGPAGSHEFHGTAWIMTQGSWQVKVTLAGARGVGALAVPLDASPTRVMRMSRPFGALLIVLGAVLIAGMAAIMGALVRQAGVEPGVDAVPTSGWKAGLGAVAACGVLLLFGNHLWRQEIARYSTNIYRPLNMQATVVGGVLNLHLASPTAAQEAFSLRRLDDLRLDHNHLMHLYAVRWPAMDEVFHLHPEQVAAGEFALALPTMPAGEYRLFADVVHADGFPETAVATAHLGGDAGKALTGDDAGGALPAFGDANAYLALADGFRYRFAVVDPQGRVTGLRVNVPVLLKFTLLDGAGKPPRDMTAYMGMAGHLAVVREDGSVFAHIHPNGSAAMAAYLLANDAAMPGMGADGGNVAAFPFGFPSAGRYRLVVQMKHGERVETGAVDVEVR